MSRLYTIGFCGWTAEDFFETLRNSKTVRLIDVRRNNNRQLDGFTKITHFPYFLRELCSMSYCYVPSLAPDQALFDDWQRRDITWGEYESRYSELISERKALDDLDPFWFSELCCLLCSEPTPEHCHRRLLAGMIKEIITDIEITHLVNDQ